MNKENIDKILSHLEEQSKRVARFSHVANGTKTLSNEMLINLEKLKLELEAEED
ncbi:MAG: hypothetical protein ACTSU6_04385 [Candidatus Njordarchaeales archaeon]